MKIIAYIFFSFLPFLSLAQTEITTVTGKIQDKNTKEALPYVSIGFKGFSVGTTSDFEGRFKISSNQKVDTLIFTYVGYKRLSKKISSGINQDLLVEMQDQSMEMGEIVINPGLNPALRIIDNARKNRKANSQDNLESYQYDSYSKVNISLSNISDEMKNNVVFKPLSSLFDTVHQMRNDEGKHVLPTFVSETFSKTYFQKSPARSKEEILGSKYSGIGIEANSYLTDLMGGQFHHYNLSNNYVRIFHKDFVTPIADAAHFYYIFTLLDSSEIDGIKCYKIQVNLKNKQDLGFEGIIWIADSSFSLKRVNLEVGKSANLNFLNRIKIQQELTPSGKGPWITSKSRVTLDFDRFKKDGFGMIAGLYNSYTHIETNVKFPAKFFDVNLITREDAFNKDSAYWLDKRTEELSSIEKEMFNKVDSVNRLPIVITYVDLIYTVFEGFKRIGKLDWGPYLYLFGYNQIEGFRMRIGFKTNYDFSKNWVCKASLAYGFKDEKIKYSVGFDYVFDPKKWSVASIRYRDDNDILGITNSPISSSMGSTFFQFANFFGSKTRINHTREINLSYTKTFSNYWTLKLLFDNRYFTPIGNFIFVYPGRDSPGSLSSSFTSSQFGIEARWAFNEVVISRGHDRILFQQSKLPVITFSYLRGVKGFLNADFNYDKLGFTVSQHSNTGIFGTADWYMYGGKTFGTLPYPLLDVARGNGSIVYSTYNYSLMNYYEFISDAYIHAAYTQRLEGLLLNKIPFIKSLKLRNAFMLKAAYGSISKANKDLFESNKTDANGNPVSAVHFFDKDPYVEVGYSIENIFRFMSIGYVQRLTYLSLPDVRRNGFNIGFRIQF